MNVLDLFSGIGGFSLGLERAGMRTVAFCEIDPYCQRVLRRHWPDVPVYGDIRELTGARLVADANYQRQLQPQGREQDQRGRAGDCGVDVICGGFPCQDISVAGKGAGIEGERSGLWSEYARIIGEVRPRYVIVENVAALLGRGLATVLGDLAALGFDAEWHCIPASAVGAPHRRDRIWVVAYPAARWSQRRRGNDSHDGGGATRVGEERIQGEAGRGGLPADVADVDGARRIEQWWRLAIREELAAAQCGDWWRAEPAMGELVDGLSGGLVRLEGRVAKGIPDRVQKLRALGNAVVPQIPELIGRAIMNMED